MFSQPTLNAKQTSWLKFLSEFDFEVRHVKGKENIFIVSLKRKFHVEAISIFQSDLRTRYFDVASRDEKYLHINEGLYQERSNTNFEGYQL